ncbi:phage holin family protein [Qipengyuania spongiae]|uniref:Phage holin family protein n=1 Tax=Qipengyuania spongiae TaxID=2909673 RepID=A0ABY5SZH4_9SPHN|nr:phage holin family protein [Qipengyuania spongiae]UVI39938.1 phage holin family protein [Qipengyuania spongiae]
MTQGRKPASAPTRQKDETGDGDVIDLIGKLTRQGSHLAQEQLALVQAEMREGVDDIKQAVAAVLGAAVVGIAGLGVLLMGLAYLLGEALENTALGTIIVGIVTLVIAGVLYLGARKKLATSNLKPERTLETVERTPDAVTGDLTHTGAKR